MGGIFNDLNGKNENEDEEIKLPEDLKSLKKVFKCLLGWDRGRKRVEYVTNFISRDFLVFVTTATSVETSIDQSLPFGQ